MISETLQRARDFEKTNIPQVAEEMTKFHVITPTKLNGAPCTGAM